MKVVVLVVTEPPHALALGVHDVQIRHEALPMPARNRLIAGRRAEDDFPIGQIAGVHAIDVVGHLRDLPQSGPVGLEFLDHPILFGRFGKQHPPGVAVQIDLAHVARVFGAVDRLHFPVRCNRREQADRIVVADPRQRRIALMVRGHGNLVAKLRPSIRFLGPRLPRNEQQPGKVLQQRIGQQRPATKLFELQPTG